jgi:hypothetical protein
MMILEFDEAKDGNAPKISENMFNETKVES